MQTRAQKRNMRRTRIRKEQADQLCVRDVVRTVLTSSQRNMYCVVSCTQVVHQEGTLQRLSEFIETVSAEAKRGWKVYCPPVSEDEIGVLYELQGASCDLPGSSKEPTGVTLGT